jgi:hypothetical protein
MRTPRFSHAILAVSLALITIFTAAAAAQRGESSLDPAQPTGITPDQIIQRFAAKEKQFKEARENYTYTQDVKVQTLDGDTPDGEFRQVVDITFDARGKRIENVVLAPQPTLTRVTMSQQDFEDIQHLMPFVLTTEEIPEYNILYVGQQREDELHTYVFDIAPRHIEKNKRYFQGRIWVDDHDFQIVKTDGKSVPDIRSRGNENLFPKFVTYREQIDNVYWFPTFTKADDMLQFSSGDVHIREIVKYTNYKRFGAKTKITYEGQEVERAPQGQPQGQPQPPQQLPPPPKQ